MSKFIGAHGRRYWIPAAGDTLTQYDIESWYHNINLELADVQLTIDQRDAFRGYYQEAGLVDRPAKQRFFLHHFGVPLSASVDHLVTTANVPLGAAPVILDLGCGTGSQSLLFALLGASVSAVDMDSLVLGVLKKRKAFYEELAGRSLAINIVEEDAFSFCSQAEGLFDGVYSLFAFNTMQPSRELIAGLSRSMKNGGRLAIQDGNPTAWLNRLFRRRDVLSPLQMSEELSHHGWQEAYQAGCTSVPYPVWNVVPNRLMRLIDNVLSKSMFLAASYLTLAEMVRVGDNIGAMLEGRSLKETL